MATTKSTQQSLNQTIIKGAGLSVEKGFTTPTEELEKRGDAIDKFGSDLGDHIIKKQKQKKEQEIIDSFNSAADEVLQMSEFMNETEFGETTKWLEKSKKEFANPNTSPEQKAVLMSDLQTRSSKSIEAKNWKLDLAKSIKGDKTLHPDAGLVNSSKLTPEGMHMQKILSGEVPMEWNSETKSYGWQMYSGDINKQRGINIAELQAKIDELDPITQFEEMKKYTSELEKIEGEKLAAELNPTGDTRWMSSGDLDKWVNENSFDTESNSVIKQSADRAKAMGGSVPTGQVAGFDYETTLNVVRENIVDKGNLRSLIYDNHIYKNGAKQSFYEDFQKSIIEGTTWKDLGVDPELIRSADPNTDNDPGKIHPDDAKVIVDHLVSTGVYLEDYITQYFADYLKEQYDAGVNSRSKPSDDNKIVASKPNTPVMKSGNFTRGNDGVMRWTPS